MAKLSNPQKRSFFQKVLCNPPGREASHSALLPGSLTLEAALVFPVFLFAMVTVLFFFRVLQVTHMTYGALAASADWMTVTEGEGEEPLLWAVTTFQRTLTEHEFPNEYLVGGKLGISWSGTQLSGDYVDLQIQYRCKLPFRMFGLGNIPVSQRVRMKKWTGYQGGGGTAGEECVVYLTPSGTVYHLSTDCTHLKLSTKIMGKEEAKSAGYTGCLLCGEEQERYGYYYVTEEGRKYHTRLDCSGLKRTVYAVRLSEVGERQVCSRCAGE